MFSLNFCRGEHPSKSYTHTSLIQPGRLGKMQKVIYHLLGLENLSNNELFPQPAGIYVCFKMISKSLSGLFAETFCITKIMYIVNGEKKGEKEGRDVKRGN